MVSFGCCLPIGSFVPQVSNQAAGAGDIVTGVRLGLDAVAACGFDFAELTVGTLVNLSDEDFDRLCDVVSAHQIKVPVVNSFIPGTLRLTGPEINTEAIEAYVRRAIDRVHGLGTHTIIFGSGGARRIPEGFDDAIGFEQIGRFLTLCADIAAPYGTVIAIEPLNQRESNVLNLVSEAMELARSIKSPRVMVLADAYHMKVEGESSDAIIGNVDLLEHVHVANRVRRPPGEPVEDDVDYANLLTTLHQQGYDRGISWECQFDDLLLQGKDSLDYLKRIWMQISEQRGAR